MRQRGPPAELRPAAEPRFVAGPHRVRCERTVLLRQRPPLLPQRAAAAGGAATGGWRASLPRGPGWATVDPACPPGLRPVAEAGGPPDGRADCCGAARGVCAVRGPPACGGA